MRKNEGSAQRPQLWEFLKASHTAAFSNNGRPADVTSYCKILPGVVSLFCYQYAVGRMPDLTTIQVSVRTRDALRELAEREGLSFNAQIEKLVRRERCRVIGSQLASAAPDAQDAVLLDASASDIADASR